MAKFIEDVIKNYHQRNWTEDYKLDDKFKVTDHLNYCQNCQNLFLGSKSRFFCKVCTK